MASLSAALHPTRRRLGSERSSPDCPANVGAPNPGTQPHHSPCAATSDSHCPRMNEITELQGRPFFVVIRCTFSCRHSTSPFSEAARMEPSALDIILRLNGSPPGFSGNFISRAPFRKSPTSPFRVAIQIPPFGSEARLCPGGSFDSGNSSCTRKSRIRTSFRGLLAHSAQMFPSMSSVSATTIPRGRLLGWGSRRKRPFSNRYSPSSTPTHSLPARSSSK